MTTPHSPSDGFSDSSLEKDLDGIFEESNTSDSPTLSPSELEELAALFESQDPFPNPSIDRGDGAFQSAEGDIYSLFDSSSMDRGPSQPGAGWNGELDVHGGDLASLLASDEKPWPSDSDGFEDFPVQSLPSSHLPQEGSFLENNAIVLGDDLWDTLAALIDAPPDIEKTKAFSPVQVAELEQLIEGRAPATFTPVSDSPVGDTTDLEPSSDIDFDDLERLLSDDPKSEGYPGPIQKGPRPSSGPQPQKIFDQTMRVSVKQLDNLSNLIGELVVKRNRLEQDQERLRQFLENLLNQVQNLSDVGSRMQDLYERTLLEGALLATRSKNSPSAGAAFILRDRKFDEQGREAKEGLDALEMDRFTGFHLLSQEMIELIVRVKESASDIQFLVDETEQVARTLRQVTNQLQEGMTKSRMVPFAQTADRLPRAIREVSMRLNKQAKLEVDGREVLIDKVILEHLYNPMTHLVNNAIAHGIETPGVRQQLGKSPEGRIDICAFLQGNQTVITVSDDGAGIDAERVKAKAIEKGLITFEESAIYSKQEVYDLLFHAGFSTRDKADDFAGRGVGLDVVRTNLLDIRGSVAIDSEMGKGTTFTIRLPLTLSICKALCCVSDRAQIAFPVDGVEHMKDYAPGELPLNEEGVRCLPWNDLLLPIHKLSELLTYNRSLSRSKLYGGKPDEDNISVVLLQGSGNYLAIQVDRGIGEQEIVIKQIEGPIPKPVGIAGATVLGDGSIMPIGDVLELIELAQGRIRNDSNANLWQRTIIQVDRDLKAESTVLIVDDSITVRELLSMSFIKAGYRVEQAKDGEEAWEKLQAGLHCDVVFCDIEMPRMNGLEFMSNLLKDKRLSSIPVALLTSRGDDRHRKVAAKLGASGYFTKPYTEKDLIDSAERMIRGEVLLPGSIKVSRYTTSEGDIDNDAEGTTGGEGETCVLIVDDSIMVREMLSMTFAKAGYRAYQARDGQEAWEKLRERQRYDLILCDIEMPRMNGLELLSRLQEDDRLSQIPIAMITSRGAQKMKRIAAERGAKGYFVKPYIEEVLLDSAKRLIAGEVLLDINSLVES